MSEQNKIYEIKAKAEKKLYEHLGFNGVDGTYIYCLTRVKEAFHVGTMTLDDFVEVDEEFVGELAELFAEMVLPLLQEIERKDEALRFYARHYRTSVILDGGKRAREAL
jgi:hypothetical protein